MTALSAGIAPGPLRRIVQWIVCVAPATRFISRRGMVAEFGGRGTTPPSVPPHRGEGGEGEQRAVLPKLDKIARARAMRKRMPPMEAKLWNALRELKPLGYHFRRQVPLGRYFADFACHQSRLVIEVDGETHTNPAYDRARDAFLREEGYRVLRVTNDDVRDHLDAVMAAVLARLSAPSAGDVPDYPHQPAGFPQGDPLP